MELSLTEQYIFDLIESVQTPRKQASLQPFVSLLGRLGNPHLRLPKTIHVAGTNGKGSVLAYLDRILSGMSYRIHRYTSPHLVSICERIQIAGQQIAPERFLETMKIVATHAYDLPLTYFELITAAAFIEFAKEPADFLLLETGMGGRYDATNVVENPVACVITQIAFDHVEQLGPLLSDIAREKAGIIKGQCPVVTLNHVPEIMDIIQNEAKHKHAPIYIAAPLNAELGLLGRHQQQNAALACQAATLLVNVQEDVLLEGLLHTQWPGRMQKITIHGREVWLDMAHNTSAAEVAADSMAQQLASPFHLIFSLRANKDMSGFLLAFKEQALAVTYVPLPDYAFGQDVTTARSIAADLGIVMSIADSLETALDNTPPGPILITGSAVLVGEAIARASA